MKEILFRNFALPFQNLRKDIWKNASTSYLKYHLLNVSFYFALFYPEKLTISERYKRKKEFPLYFFFYLSVLSLGIFQVPII